MNTQTTTQLKIKCFKLRPKTMRNLEKAKKKMTWDELFNRMAIDMIGNTSTKTTGNTGNTSKTRKPTNKGKLEVIPAGNTGNTLNELITLFKPIDPTYEQIYKNTTQRNALQYLVDKFTYGKIKNLLEQLPEILKEKYSPQIYSPITLKNKFAQLIAFCRKRGVEQNTNKLRSI